MGVKTVLFSYFNGLIMLNGNPFNIPWMSESFIVIAQFWRNICTELLWKTNGCNLTHIGQSITVVTFLTHKTKLAVFQEDYQWGLQRFYYLGRLIYPVAWVPSSGAIVSILGLGDSKRHHGCNNTNIDTRYNDVNDVALIRHLATSNIANFMWYNFLLFKK